MIKKILLSLGLIGFGLLNYSNAGNILLLPNETQVKDGVEITCDNKFNCQSTFNGITINGLNYGFSKSYYGFIFWYNNDLGYVFDYGGPVYQYIFSGNTFKTTSYGIATTYDRSIIDYMAYSGTITLNDWITNYSDKDITSYKINGNGSSSTICFNYTEDILSVCMFVYGQNSAGRESYNYGLTRPLTNEQIIGLDFGLSPFGGGSSSNIPITGGQSPISGGYTYMNCTNQNVLAYYTKTFGYNGNMCDLNSGGVVDGYYPYGTLREFCNIYYTFYNIDGTYLNQLYTGHNKNIVCDSPNAYFDYSGDNVSSIDWSDEFPGVINGSGEYEVQSSDSFLINLTNILKGNFYLPEAGDFGLGYLPRYIILGFMGVIFFNFIRK